MTYNSKNTDPNFFNNQNFAIGFEPEFKHVNGWEHMQRFNSSLGSNKIKALEYVVDYSRCDGEGRLPILSNCEKSYNYLKSVLEQLNDQNATVNWECSVHIHISRRPIIIDPTDFHDKSIAHTERTGHPLSSARCSVDNTATNREVLLFGKAIPIEIAKDVGIRVLDNKDQYNSLLAPSRIDDGGFAVPAMRRASRGGQPNGYFCKLPRSKQAIQDAVTFQRIQSAVSTNGKFSSINLNHWNDYETIEFRSHGGSFDVDKLWSYAMFLINMISHSITARHVQAQEMLDTPDFIGRSSRTRQSLAYAIMRREGGATTQEIMNASGIASAQNVRRMISEQIRPLLRQQFGMDIIQTHTQQYYNHAYSTSQGRYDLSGYEIPFKVNSLSQGVLFIGNRACDLLVGLDNDYKSNLKPFRITI